MRPERKGLRLNEYDYSSPGCYFITVCTRGRQSLFWSGDHVETHHVGATLGRPQLSPVGLLVEEEIQRIPQVYPHVTVDKYVIMPNHIHLILVIHPNDTAGGRSGTAPTVSTILPQTKGRASRRAGFSLWQKSFHDHVIRERADYEEIWQYIHNNPLKWKLDCYYEE